MKLMKNTMKCLVAVFMMAMAFAATGVTAEARELCELKSAVELQNYGTGEMILPEADYMIITQTGATSNSVSVSWNAIEGATKYGIYYGERYIDKTTATSYTIELAEFEYETTGYVYIFPLITYEGVDYAVDEYNYQSQYVYPAPMKLKEAAVTFWNPTKKYISSGKYMAEIAYQRNSYYPDGYEIRIYNLSDKKIKTLTSSSYEKSFSIKSGKLKKCWNKGLKYEVLPYKMINGTPCYGESTGKKVFIPQATMKKTTSQTISWTKVSGAKGYYIYLSTNYGKKFKKVKTVGKNTTSAYIKNYKKSSSSYNPRYQIYVIPYGVKVGKKKYKGTATIVSSYYSY